MVKMVVLREDHGRGDGKGRLENPLAGELAGVTPHKDLADDTTMSLVGGMMGEGLEIFGGCSPC